LRETSDETGCVKIRRLLTAKVKFWEDIINGIFCCNKKATLK